MSFATYSNFEIFQSWIIGTLAVMLLGVIWFGTAWSTSRRAAATIGAAFVLLLVATVAFQYLQGPQSA